MATGLLPIHLHTVTHKPAPMHLDMEVTGMRQVTGRPHLPSIYNSGEGKQLAAPIVSFDKRSHYGAELRNEKNEIVVRGPCPAWTDSPQYVVGRWRPRSSSPQRPPS